MRGIDLHVHTIASDGDFTVREIVKKAKAIGLAGIAITDHDTVSGLTEIKKISKEEDFLIIPGIEISTVWEGQAVHILGYLFRPQDRTLHHWLEKRLQERVTRAKNIIRQLKDMGLDLDEDEILTQQNHGSLGRVHIGQAMIRKGYASSLDEVFHKWLGERGCIAIPPHLVTPKDAIDVIHEAGGASVVAHPGLSGCDQWLDLFCTWGLDGIEAYHPEHKKKQEQRYMQLAAEKGLLLTGGSDFHRHGLGKRVVDANMLPANFFLIDGLEE